MSALREQQQRLRNAVIAADPGDTRELLAGSARGLAVYRDAYTARLIAALRDNHAVLAQAMGDDGFDALARAYVAAQPSRHASIRWFGHRLAEFMADADAGELVPHPAMVDIARMDWALRSAFDAADAPALAFETLAALPPEAWPALRFVPHPSAQCLALGWRIEPAWRVLQSAEPGGEAPDLPEPEALAHSLLVWRQLLETRWRSLDDAEAALWQALAAGADFAALCDIAAQHHGAEAAAAAVASALRQWVADGVLGGIDGGPRSG